MNDKNLALLGDRENESSAHTDEEEQYMGRYTSDPGGGNFQPAPAGSHIARCIRVIDLGTQHDEYQGKPLVRNRVLIMWELCHEMMDTDEGPRPFIVSQFYTNSLQEKANLRADLEQWRGRAFTDAELGRFDLQSIVGVSCMLAIIHTDKGKAHVSGVMKLPKGQEAPPPQNKTFAFWLDEFNAEVFAGLSPRMQEMIRKSPEYQDAMKPKAAAPTKAPAFEDMENDIPF